MASGTADLQRDLGGAIMQSVLGALLTIGYASSFDDLIAGSPQSSEITGEVTAQLTRSFAGAQSVASGYPQYSTQILQAANESFVAGQKWAFFVGLLAMGLGVVVVWLGFPDKADEAVMLASYEKDDALVDA
jgi:hypothetical protein